LQAEANASNPLRRFIPGRQQRIDLEASSLHRLMEAQRLAFADRQLYSADPAFVNVPLTGLLDDNYIRARAALIKDRAMPEAIAGQPSGAPKLAADPSLQSFGTTHISIVDSEGHWVAITSSIESAFGSRLMIDGLLMNNQLTDFSFVPTIDGVPVANRVQPGKRPRSAMSPVIVLSTRGEPLLATGSAGGVRIMGYNSRTLSAWLLGVRDARKLMSLPHVLARGDIIEYESDLSARAKQELSLRGHEPIEATLTSGSNVILRYGRGLQGATDPRRPGTAAGY
jgi:gamma-glutamyltranspeptidase/glutathione hydrolase